MPHAASPGVPGPDRVARVPGSGIAPAGDLDVDLVGPVGSHLRRRIGEDSQHNPRIELVDPPFDQNILGPEVEPLPRPDLGAAPPPCPLPHREVKVPPIVDPDVVSIPVVVAGTDPALAAVLHLPRQAGP